MAFPFPFVPGQVLTAAELNAAFASSGGGESGGVTFSSREDALTGTIPASTSVITTGGYNTVGDGGGATYVRTDVLQFPSYGIHNTHGSGSFWEYVPEPDGWNARVAGVVADGATEDSANLMRALLPFQNPEFIVGGGNIAGTLMLPGTTALSSGVMKISSPIIVAGSNGTGLDFAGQSAGNQGGAVSTCLQWHGANNYPSMMIVYSTNNFHSVGVNYDGSLAGTGLLNCIHFTSDNTYLNSLQAAITTPGAAKTFQVTSTSSLVAGVAIAIGRGTSHFEIVYIKSVTDGTHFVADCVNPHAINEVVGGGTACNSLFVEKSSIAVPSSTTAVIISGGISGNILTVGSVVQGSVAVGMGIYGNGISEGTIIESQSGGSTYVLSAAGLPTAATGDVLTLFTPTAGVLCGNTITQTVQAAEFTFHNCNFISALPNVAYSGIRIVGGGNVKNYTIDNCSFIFLRYGMAGEQCSGNIKITYPTFFGTRIADVMMNGGNITLDNLETESDGQRMLVGTGAGTPQNATLTNCQFQSGPPADFYVITWGGNLTLINNIFLNAVQTASVAFTASISGYFMNVTAVSSGIVAKGGVVNFSGVLANTVVVDGPSGGQEGLYTLSKSQTATSQAMTMVDTRYQVPERVQCSNVSSGATTGRNPSAVASIGNYFQYGSTHVPVFYNGSNIGYNFGSYVTDQTQSLWNLLQVNDYGDFGVYDFTMGRLATPVGAMSAESVPAGITVNHLGYLTDGLNVITIPYTFFNTSATTKSSPIIGIPSRTFITAIVADVTQTFTDNPSADTVQAVLNFGDGASLSFASFFSNIDVHTALSTTGLLDTDFNPAFNLLRRQNAGTPNPNASFTSFGWIAPGSWSSGNTMFLNMVSGSAKPLNLLTQGSVTLYIGCKKFA